jgi:hypothetical protein
MNCRKQIRSLAAITLILSLNMCLSAQTRQPLHEKALLLTDRQLYICGEKILFNAFTYDADSFLRVSISTVLYTELCDQDNKVIARGKYVISSGLASGFIGIPRTINSGVFYLRAYTNFMRNFGEEGFAVCRLKIINPLSAYKIKISDPSSHTSVARPVNGEPFGRLRISIISDSSVYGRGESAGLKLRVTDDQGNAVKTNVLVTASLASDDEENNMPDIQKDTLLPGYELQNYHDLKFLPEMRGDIITGKAIFRGGEPAAGIRVLQSFTGTSSCIESCITGNDGSFRFMTANEKNRGDLILKADVAGREVNLIPDDEFSGMFPEHPYEKTELSPEEIELVKKMFVNVQVEDAFSFRDSIRSGNVKPGIPFYGDDYDEYDFSNYLRLPNMKEFAFEIILGVTTSKVSRQDVIHITDKRTFRDIGPQPLILIDGVPVTDHSLALSIDPEKVRLVRVVRDKFFYKDQVFDGILDIITKSGNADSFSLPGGTVRQAFIHPEAAAEAVRHPITATGDKIPDYRNLLYFNNGIETDERGMASVSFKTPDNTGIFRFRCFVMTPDGKAGEETYMIKVR